MKTYWLEGRRDGCRGLPPPAAAEEVVAEAPQPEDPVSEVATELEDDRSVYSPVTFQEIAKRSLASSPKRQAGKC